MPTDTDFEATPTFMVVEQMGIIVPEVPNKWFSHMLVYVARVRGYEQVMTPLVDSGASQNFENLPALKKSPTIYEARCRDGMREEVTVRLADDTLVKLDGVHVELAFSFSEFSCKDNFTVLGMESPYDLILGMSWSIKHQP